MRIKVEIEIAREGRKAGQTRLGKKVVSLMMSIQYSSAWPFTTSSKIKHKYKKLVLH